MKVHHDWTVNGDGEFVLIERRLTESLLDWANDIQSHWSTKLLLFNIRKPNG